jgi:hypothetical protein
MKKPETLKTFEVYHLAPELWVNSRATRQVSEETLGYYEKARDNGQLKAVAQVQAAHIEEVYTLTNTLDEPWYLAGGPVKMLVTGGVRSTSVGDVVLVDGAAFLCAPFGFEEIPGLSPAPQARSTDKAKAYVMNHAQDGVFLGLSMGLGFWSKLDPVGQDSAPVFPSEKEGREFLGTWSLEGMDAAQRQAFMDAISFVEVEPSGDGKWATMTACVKAGLDMWDPNEGMSQPAPVMQ